MLRAELRLLVTAATSLPEEEQNLPAVQSLYADYTDDWGPNENLYQHIGASDDFGGIQSAQGQSSNTGPLNYGPSANPIPKPTQEGPNAQPMLNGTLKASLRILASRLGMEDDPLTHDQENYGTGSHLKEALTPSFAAETTDGDFDAHGYLGGDRSITHDPQTTDYLNVTGESWAPVLDAALAMTEVESDADPQLFNTVTQPMGMSG